MNLGEGGGLREGGKGLGDMGIGGGGKPKGFCRPDLGAMSNSPSQGGFAKATKVPQGRPKAKAFKVPKNYMEKR